MPKLEIFDKLGNELSHAEMDKQELNINQMIFDGDIIPKKGTRVDITDPDNPGDSYNVPAEELSYFLEQGFVVEGYNQKVVREYKKDLKENSSLAQALSVFGEQAMDEFALGLPELALDLTQDPLDRAKREALKEEYSTANLFGGLTGGIGSLAYGPAGLLGRAGAAASKGVAGQVMKIGGGQVAKKTAEKMGQGLIQKAGAKTLGGAADAFINVAPHAITEAALGDPTLAAESLMFNMGLGTMISAPFSKLPTTKLAKEVREQVASTSERKEKLIEKMGSFFTGVRKENIRYYIDNHERMIANPPRMGDEIAEDLKLKIANLKDRSALDQGTIDLHVDDFVRDVDNLKNQVIQGKEAALTALDNSDQLIPKKVMIDALDDLDSTITKVPIPMGSGDALSRIDGWKKALKAFPEEFIGPRVVSQQIRDIDDVLDWSRQVGGFDPAKERIGKAFRKSLRKSLGNISPEYDALMVKLAEKADLLSRVTKRFLPKSGSTSSVNSLFKNISKDMRKQDVDLLSELGELTENANDYRALMSDMQSSRKTFEEISAISGGDQIGTVRNYVKANPSLSKNEAVEKLDEVFGSNLSTELKDFGVINDFSTAKIQGSRRVALGGLLGSTLGGGFGGPLGSAIGGAGGLAGFGMDILGGPALRNIIDATMQSKGGIVFAEGAMGKAAKKFDNFADVLRKRGKYQPEISTSARRVLYSMFMDSQTNDDEFSKDSAYLKATKTLTEIAINPQILYARMNAITDPIAEGGAPIIANELAASAQRAVSYLFDELPKPGRPTNVFSSVKWEPPKYEMKALEDKAMVVNDPFIVVDLLAKNMLNKNHMDALQEVYPAIYQQMQRQVLEAAASGEMKATYNERIKLSYLMDIQLDPSLDNIDYLQQTFAADLTEEEEGQVDQARARTVNNKVSLNSEKSIKSGLSPSQVTQSNLV